ncbi:MAG: cytochrome c-type biogenesis protein CcmH [Acidimicrobiia bacterium]|nr:cytochrome c-type biogenesis protein CcmH [Acidimicrobiia bacterium]MBT8194762.1 cytochrome c-type biogenesis protein CcmH [Acidimicrobiia bacterium]MBT8247986.1 cytochrome c-type biogenesis protein CcmH [Acidimicrobiia bacterium]NNF87091.1 cytochrome c-type biogenesis protein CcmH [Acidimicrobiia bacterium]NNL14809.1 cytochrome c-type biogenesis protein CcmH [Acidimicrobiia bacterium]
MSESLRKILAGAVTVGLAIVVVVGIVIGDSTPQDRVQALGSSIKCPVCQGEAIADSPSETATAMMDVVAEKVEEGLSDDQVFEYFRVRYGDGILLDPRFEAKTLLLWLLPLAAVGLGVVMILRRRQAPAPTVSGEELS